jgi:serralysin
LCPSISLRYLIGATKADEAGQLDRIIALVGQTPDFLKDDSYMATVSQVTSRPESGMAHIDALVGEAQPWNFLGRDVLYYSFSVTSGGETHNPDVNLATRMSFNETQKGATRAILSYVSQVTGIRFAETADGNQADIHFAYADIVHPYITGLAMNGYTYQYMGSEVTRLNVDSWVYLDSVQWASENQSPTAGSWGYETLLHEIGHVLGLKHPFDGDDVLPGGADHTGNTLMSYTSSGGAHTTFSPYDLAALDWLYGRDGLGGQSGVGTGGRHITGTAGHDTLRGGNTADRFEGLAGNDTLDGGAGYDCAAYAGMRARYTLSKSGTATLVRDNTGAEGTDTLVNVERVQFTDMSINLTVGDLAKSIGAAQLNSLVELYIAYLDRVPDADGMAHWIGQLKGGQSLAQIGDAFYSSGVHFGSLTGYSAGMSNADFVSTVYSNVLGRSSVDASGMAYWTQALASGAETRASLVAEILGSAHTFKGHATWGWVADLLDNKIAVGTKFAITDGLSYNSAESSISQGMAIVDAITPSSTAQAVSLIGVTDGFNLMG